MNVTGYFPPDPNPEVNKIYNSGGGKDRIDKHPIGGVWEEPQWEVHYNDKSDFTKKMRCKHSIKNVVPRVIVCLNEGGYNSTGLCLDCVLEAYGKDI
jgi:hypothetical protein